MRHHSFVPFRRRRRRKTPLYVVEQAALRVSAALWIVRMVIRGVRVAGR